MSTPFRGSGSDLTPQRLRGKRFVKVTRDVYVMKDRAVDLRTRAEGAQLVFPDATVCLWTAALLLNLPLPRFADEAESRMVNEVVHLDRGKHGARSVRPEIKVHRLAIAQAQVYDLYGLPVSDGPRTFADLSAHLALEALVALGDVVARRCKPADILAAVAGHGRRPGAVLLRTALPLLDEGSDSPAETRARLRLHAAGFTALKHKVTVKDRGGGWLGVPDLADPVAKVALQHEGAVHFDRGVARWRRDVARDEVVRQENWQVVASTAIDDARPERLIEKVTAAYLRAAMLWGPHVLPQHLR